MGKIWVVVGRKAVVGEWVRERGEKK